MQHKNFRLTQLSICITMVLIYIAVVVIIFVWLLNRWHYRASVKLAYKIPSNKWHTFWGWGKIFRTKDTLSYTYNYGKKYGPNSIMWMGPFPLFLTSDPRTIKDILISKNCVNKPSVIMNGMTTAVGLGLISASEPFWSRHRNVMIKTFSHKNLLTFLPIFQQQINTMIQEIDRNVEKEDNVINMLDMFHQLTLKSTVKTILKRDLDRTKFDSVTMINNLNIITEYIIQALINIFWRINCIRKLSNILMFKNVMQGLAVFRKFIDESWNILQTNATTESSYLPKINSALDYALNGVRKNMIEVHEIPGEIMQLFVASFETTATTMYFVLLMLSMHPEYQERAYEEIVNILPDDNDEGVITLEQLDQLIYLEMLLNETMRVLPVLPMIVREVANENLVLNNNLSLPVGQGICIDIFSLHRSKEIWGPNAHIFNPDNFLPSNIASRHSFSFIPFAKGQRFCIGWRFATLFIKMCFVKLIKSYKFTTDFKYENMRFENRITLKLLEEPQFHVQQREFGK